MMTRLIIRLVLLSAMVLIVRDASRAVPATSSRNSTTLTASTKASTSQTAGNWPIAYRHVMLENPSLHIHLATIDLNDSRAHVRVRPGGPDPDGPGGRWELTLNTVQAIAQRDDLDVAVNGNFFTSKDVRSFAGHRNPYFSGNWAQAVGFAVSDGWHYGIVPSYGADGPSIIFDSKGRPSIDRYATLPADTQQCVTGSDWLVKDGQPCGTTKDTAPRTAAGIDQKGKTLYLVVVDGRREDYSAGMTGPQLGEYLAKIGCWRAIMLDGGGSSTMVCRNSAGEDLELKSRPSDGHGLPISMSFERAVDNVIGVTVER